MKKKIILSVNAGSSSVKVSVYSATAHASPTQLAEAQINGLTSPPPKLTYIRGTTTVHKDKVLLPTISDGDGDTSTATTTATTSTITTQKAAFQRLLQTLLDDPALPAVRTPDDIHLVCHRVVHGGDFRTAQLITPSTLHRLEALGDLAPLHNGPALAIVRACVSGGLLLGEEEVGGGTDGTTGPTTGGSGSSSSSSSSKIANVACFDTQFHATLPPHVRTYPIDQDVARANGLRKYGFHGISYASITRSATAFLRGNKDGGGGGGGGGGDGGAAGGVNLIALHLGSGASGCAIRNGKSWDTSMGLTPLAGLPGATRSGSIDPSLVFHYASDVGKLSPSSTRDLHISVAETILNKEAGWRALTGTTDFGAITARAYPPSSPDAPTREPDPRCRLAFDLFVDRIAGLVGAYYVALAGRVDALVFAGGIGERCAPLRAAVVRQCACLGFDLDDEKNESVGKGGGGGDDGGAGEEQEKEGEEALGVWEVGRPVAKGKEDGWVQRVLVVRTDEQFEMARAAADDPALWGDDDGEEDGEEVPDLTLLRVKSGHD